MKKATQCGLFHFGGDEGVVRGSHCLCDPRIPKRMRFGTTCNLGIAGVLREQCSLVEPEGSHPNDPAGTKRPLKAAFLFLVEMKGIEPSTFALRTRRSPS
jgi:hypothetical protein